MPEFQSEEELRDAFEKILASKEACKDALKDPSKVLMKYGVRIADPDKTNETLFATVPQIRAHFVAVAAGKPHDPKLLGCDSPGCLACKAGLNTGGVAVITALVLAWPEDTAVIAPVAAFCGISEAAVTSVFAGLAAGGGVTLEAAISGLCGAMGAC